MTRRRLLRGLALAAGAAALVVAGPAWARQDGDPGQKGNGGNGEKPGEKPGEKGDKPGDKPGEKPGEKSGGEQGDKPGQNGDKPGEKPGEKGDKPGEKQAERPRAKDPKDTPEWKACEAIGAEFAGKRAKALAARVRPGGKLDVKLGEKSGRYAPDQAAEVLDEWFKGKGELTVTLRSVKDLVATFDLTVRRAGTDREVKRQLLVEIQKRDKGEGFHLVKLEKV